MLLRGCLVQRRNSIRFPRLFVVDCFLALKYRFLGITEQTSYNHTVIKRLETSASERPGNL